MAGKKKKAKKKKAKKKAAARPSARDALFKALADAQEMASDAITVAEKGLNANPTREQRRILNEDILELNAKFTKLQGHLLALARGGDVIARPTDRQLRELARLSASVDRMVNRSVSASQAVRTVGEVLELAHDAGLV